MNRKRKNHLKDDIKEVKHPIYFEDGFKPTCPVTFIETKPIDIDGIKKNYYYANNIGEVYNIKGKLIKPDKLNTGYYNYRLVTDDTCKSKYKHVLSHRLFMQTFCPDEYSEDLTINHKNMNPKDNKLKNLEMSSQKENNDKKDEVYLLDGTKNYQSKFSFQDLITIVDELDKHTSYKEILEMLDKPTTSNYCDYVGNIKRGKTYTREVEMIRNMRRSND